MNASAARGWRMVLAIVALLPVLIGSLAVSGVAAESPGQLDTNGISFSFDPGIRDADRNDAVEGTLLGQDVIGGFVGTDGLDDVRIIVSIEASEYSQYIMASTTRNQIEVFTGGDSWQSAPPIIRIETMVHELMHVYQNALEQELVQTVPLWFDEGTAEALGYLAITQLGVVDQDDIYALNEYLLTRYPVEGSLANLQAYGSMDADSYPLAYLAVQYLLGIRGMSVSALAQVYENIGNGQQFGMAFENVFGQSLDGFYVDFDSWRANLLRVTDLPIDFVTPHSSGAPASASWLDENAAVTRGDQLVLVISTDPGADCTLQLLIPGSPVERETEASGDGEAFWLVTIPDTAAAGQISARASCGGGAVWQDVAVT